jgi:hypothetical protein
MPWIESHTTLARHPKALRLSRRLGVSLPAAIGHLHLLWWWALEYAQEGDLSGFDAEEIALSCAWEGEPEHLLESLKACGFVDGCGAIHDWHDYAGKLLDQRKANAEKQARWRNRNRLSSIEGDNRNVTVTGETGDGDVTVTSPLRNGATVPNRTVPNPSPTGKKARGADAPAVLAEHQAVINAYLGAIGREPKDVGAGYKRYLATGAEMAKRGDGPEDVAGCTRYLLNADWRRRGGTVPTLENVRDYLAEWVKDGRLERPPVAAGGAPQHAQRKSVTATAMEGINGALSIAAGRRAAGGAAGRGGGREDDPPVRPGPVGQELRRQLPG